jgi:predicted negative regulator of RcsB-dependent stress response
MKLLQLVACLALFPFLRSEAATVLTVKEDGAPLRAACSTSAEKLADLFKGQQLKVRFALAGSSSECFSVSAEVAGKTVAGYVAAEAVAGIDDFEKQRRAASSAATQALPQVTRSEVDAARAPAAPAANGTTNYALAAQLNLAADALQNGRPADAEKILSKISAPPGDKSVALLRAYTLMALNQPDRALTALEPAMRQTKNDPQLLAVAGRAAYSLDDSRQALAYWRESLDLHPDSELEKVYKKVEKEVGSDKSKEKSYGMRFLLRYDTAAASPELARNMVEVLDQEFSRIQSQLGCPADERIVTIVQTPEVYYQGTGVAEWSGGHYDGKIRIPLAKTAAISPALRRVFAHEITHAGMAIMGRWPTWVHEGMAQKLSGDTLQPAQRQMLKAVGRAGQLPKLEDIGNGWATLSATQASVAYSYALAAMELFFERYGDTGPRNLMNNPSMLDRVTPDLDKALAETLK